MFRGPPRAPRGRPRQIELLLRTRQSDIGEAMLFSDLRSIIHGTLVGESAILQTRDEHVGELQSFGGVHGHQSDFPNPVVLPRHLVRIRN